MIAFEILVNGQKKFTAGGDYQTLIASLTLVHLSDPYPKDHSLLFGACGIVPQPTTIAFWPECAVSPGDRIEIRIIDADEVDSPERVDKQESTDGSTA